MELARDGANKVWTSMKESVRWMGEGEPAVLLEMRGEQDEMEESDSESNENDMEV